MFYWKKLGNIFNPTTSKTKSWMEEYSQLPVPYIYSDKLIRVYFATRPKKDIKNNYVSRSGYVDLNRNNLKEVINIGSKPLFELGLPGSFDEFGSMTSCFLDVGDKIYGYYTGWSRLETVPYTMAIGLAISSDKGETFQKISDGPILGQTTKEPFLLSGPKIIIENGLWHMWYLVGTKWLKNKDKFEPVYKFAHATSKDGINWNRNGRQILESKYENECQVSFSVFKFKDKWNAIFAYRQPTNYRGNSNGSYRLGYAWSNDLQKWNRDDDKVGINVSQNGWDSEMIAYPHIMEIDEKIYLFYCGNEFGKFGFGIAELINFQ